jgi:alanine racemase
VRRHRGGVRLRDFGIEIPILIFGALAARDLDGIFTHDLTPSVSTPGAGRALQEAAARRGVQLRCHLKIDTGMNRLGLRHDNLRRTLPELAASRNLWMEAVYTHFATADDPDSPLFEEQRRRFEAALGVLQELDIRPPFKHAANSSALVRDPRVWHDYVRPGILLYGVVPPPLESPIRLSPALTLKSRITATKGMRPGESVGYGARFRSDVPRTIATVPAGYADGIDLRLAGRGCVLVRGKRAPIVGSVCMDMISVDVTGIAADPGDEVVILGQQGDEQIDVREMAAAAGTIPYEVLVRIGRRIERVYT